LEDNCWKIPTKPPQKAVQMMSFSKAKLKRFNDITGKKSIDQIKLEGKLIFKESRRKQFFPLNSTHNKNEKLNTF
jgi:hypothetical protein